MSPDGTRRRMGGFTLLEAIVTLVVVALIMAMMMQALTQALGIRERVRRFQSESRISMLQEQWFRDTVSAAIADLDDAYGPFTGDGRGLDVLTLAPLGRKGLQRVQWKLMPVAGGYALHYLEGSRDLIVVPGPLRAATFEYMNADGRWQHDWKPSPGDVHVLPRGVRLQADTSAGVLSWRVRVLAEPEAPPLLRLDDPVTGI